MAFPAALPSTPPLSESAAPIAGRWVELLSAEAVSEAVSGTAISDEAVSKEPVLKEVASREPPSRELASREPASKDPASEEALSAGTMAPRRAGFGMTCDSLMHSCWNKMGTQSSGGCSGRSAPIKRVFGAKSGTVFSGGSRRALLSAPPRHAPVAQLDRALPSEGRGHRFESCRVHHHLPCSPQTPDISGEISPAASQL